MPKPLGMLTRQQVVERARSACGKGIHYKLGAGGRDPHRPLPAADGLCDCSGFVAWCLGIDRFIPNALLPHLPDGGDWFETTAVYRDARSPFGFVDEVPWRAAQIGDLVVWPDRGRKQGHIGIVTMVSTAGEGPVLVVHCSVGNDRKGDAIAETSSDIFFNNGAIGARVRWVT